jgi:hypothetical protein
MDQQKRQLSGITSDGSKGLAAEDSTERNSYERLEQCKATRTHIISEIDLELQESELLSRAERKKAFINNRQYLVERRTREWLIKRGKANLLDFQDE